MEKKINVFHETPQLVLQYTTTLNCTYLFIYPTHPPDYRRKDKHLSLQNPLLSVKGVGICPNVAGAAISD